MLGVSEQTLYAKVDSRCRELGAQRLAYPPVVAGGERANTIHYINNNQVVNDGEMVLMDAGCEYHAFSSDITRTWPINGKFTDPQKILYEIVLKTQKEIIYNMMAEGYPTLDSLFTRMCLLLGKYLQEEGIIKKTVPEKDLPKLAYSFCPHHVSHYLGMDVHDTPLIPRSIPIHPGMIITVEPGIYIPETRLDVPEQFRGLGVRIEDDILVTNQGPMILTHYCAKEIADVEKLFQSKLK
ncbi:xaa-Pro aminopeptidase 3-like [Ctenocephalides felis]|uniref:xaa-Pro aminopeptidase 3-like n=1 Tax=Ctenocephalides felis TaxID=7515 RepID=UPI000E6E4552|nr:xaa-Pro aminopeptidase 3-like [Ctenocephalides felis]